MNRAVLWLGYVLALALGALSGFFFVINSIFSDIFALWERMLSFALIFALYVILGMIFGGASPKRLTRWFWLLTGPGLVMVVLYTLGEPNVPLHAFVTVVMSVGAYFGLRAGQSIKKNRQLSPFAK